METVQKIYDNDVIFINRSNYDGEEFLRINIIHSKRFSRAFLALGIISLAVALFLLLVCLYVKEFRNSDITLLISLAIIGVTFVSTYFCIPVLLKRNKRILDGMNYEFLFYEDKIVISATSNNLNAEETRLYNEIKYATIIDDLVFLYVTKTQAYIMKNDPNMERIIEFLKSKNINFTKIK